MKRLLFLITILLCSLSSCKKDSDMALPASLAETAWKGEFIRGEYRADASMDFDQKGKAILRIYSRRLHNEDQYGPYISIIKPRTIQLKNLGGEDVELWFVEFYNGKEMTLVSDPGSIKDARTLQLKRIF